MPNDTFASKMASLHLKFDALNSKLNNNSSSSPGLEQRLDAMHNGLAGNTNSISSNLQSMADSFGYSTSSNSNGSGT